MSTDHASFRSGGGFSSERREPLEAHMSRHPVVDPRIAEAIIAAAGFTPKRPGHKYTERAGIS